MYKAFVISYSGSKAPSFKEAVKLLGSWANYFDNQYIVCSIYDAGYMRKFLDGHINVGTDKLLIVEVNLKSLEGWLPQNAWDWLNEQKSRLGSQNINY